jgi:Fe-S cluster assembly protein SufD
MNMALADRDKIIKNNSIVKLEQQTLSLVFVDGCFVPEQSELNLLPAVVLFCPFNVVVDWLKGAFIYVPQNCDPAITIRLKFHSTKQQSAAIYLRNTIVLEENSNITIIEEYVGELAENTEINTATEFQLGKNSVLHYYKLQDEALTTKHNASILLQQQEASQAKAFFADCGALFAQTNVRVNLHEKYAACDLSGLYRLNHADQQINNYIHIDHAAEHGVSTMHFKGILAKNSRAEFTGKVYVHENAQHVNATQSNHNLLLSTQAEVSTKPELEIYADDVKCAHGATVGQLDEEALFYLRSRGIEKNEALQLLTQAFAEDIMNKIETASIRDYIQERMNRHE